MPIQEASTGCPQPDVCPFVLPFGCLLLCAGLSMSASLSCPLDARNWASRVALGENSAENGVVVAAGVLRAATTPYSTRSARSVAAFRRREGLASTGTPGHAAQLARIRWRVSQVAATVSPVAGCVLRNACCEMRVAKCVLRNACRWMSAADCVPLDVSRRMCSFLCCPLDARNWASRVALGENSAENGVLVAASVLRAATTPHST